MKLSRILAFGLAITATVIIGILAIVYVCRPWFTIVAWHDILPITEYEPTSHVFPPYIIWMDVKHNSIVAINDCDDPQYQDGVFGRGKEEMAISFLRRHYRQILKADGSERISYLRANGKKVFVSKQENTLFVVRLNDTIDQASLQMGEAQKVYQLQLLPGMRIEDLLLSVKHSGGFIGQDFLARTSVSQTAP